MNRTCILLVAMVLAACTSQTQVHVFSLGIEERKIADLSIMLSDAGFDARPNSLPVPGTILRNTVIFPAIVQDFATVELVETVLADAGYSDARLILETEANHYYSTDNIGVYLIDPDFEGSSASLIANPYALGGDDATALSFNYFSECPEGSEAQSELNLYPSGVVLLEEFVWDELQGNELSVIHDGEWTSSTSSVEVKLFDLGEMLFLVEELEGSNWYGPYTGISLRSQFSTVGIESCDYTYLEYRD